MCCHMFRHIFGCWMKKMSMTVRYTTELPALWPTFHLDCHSISTINIVTTNIGQCYDLSCDVSVFVTQWAVFLGNFVLLWVAAAAAAVCHLLSGVCASVTVALSFTLSWHALANAALTLTIYLWLVLSLLAVNCYIAAIMYRWTVDVCQYIHSFCTFLHCCWSLVVLRVSTK